MVDDHEPFFLFGRCVSAEAAAVFAALLELGLRSTCEAAEAARGLVTSRLGWRPEPLPFD